MEGLRRAASRLAAAGGSGIPVSVVDCLARFDHRPVVVMDERIDARVRGAVARDAVRWIVLLNEDDGRAQARFTLAHELGHMVLGDVREPWCGGEEGSRGSRERLCDVFAAELLMPGPLVRAAWRRTPEVEALAAQFDVPLRAMERRFGELGLQGS